jgi:hypothetical protein
MSGAFVGLLLIVRKCMVQTAKKKTTKFEGLIYVDFVFVIGLSKFSF